MLSFMAAPKGACLSYPCSARKLLRAEDIKSDQVGFLPLCLSKFLSIGIYARQLQAYYATHIARVSRRQTCLQPRKAFFAAVTSVEMGKLRQKGGGNEWQVRLRPLEKPLQAGCRFVECLAWAVIRRVAQGFICPSPQFRPFQALPDIFSALEIPNT